MKSSDLLSLSDGNGFVVNQVFGKTLRGNENNVFALKPVQGAPYCPVTNLHYHLALADKMGVSLKDGFLFRVTDKCGYILDLLFVNSAVSNRLKKHLKDLDISDGRTVHGFRSSCSITLSLLGMSHEEVARHVGWKSVSMVSHYCQLDKVMATDDASSVLSHSATKSSSLNLTTAERLGNSFRERNFLKGFKPVFS